MNCSFQLVNELMDSPSSSSLIDQHMENRCPKIFSSRLHTSFQCVYLHHKHCKKKVTRVIITRQYSIRTSFLLGNYTVICMIKNYRMETRI